MCNIIKLNKNDILINIVRRNIESKDYKTAISILEKIDDKKYHILKLLLELYLIEEYSYNKVVKVLKNMFLFKDLNSFEATLIIKKIKESKRNGVLFFFIRRSISVFSTDPFFKIELVKLLINNSKYKLSYNLLKDFKRFLSPENYMFYRAYILREKNKRLRSMFYFYKLVKNYPFNIVYRYFFSCLLEELNLVKTSKKHINFIKDFIKFIPKIINYDPDDIGFKKFIFKTIWDDFSY
ncbi:MAG TPA: hypothetical protein PKW55_03305 [Spirochaetota bacterium]|nr:hypothetical protein [Spirochaetota bacterium]HOM38137.1 hypothetical protein [Spirochaetota bacterium]HPQ48940.1 hypothetical protein [Spirochaetota bacterium]